MVTVLWTGSDRFGQLRTGVKHYFSSTVSRTLSKFDPAPKPACSFLTVPRSKQALSTAGKDPDLQWLHNEQSLGSPEVAARPISGQSEEGKRVGKAERQSALVER